MEQTMKLLKQGDRIRLNVRTLAGWKGMGTVPEDQLSEGDVVEFVKDADVCTDPPSVPARCSAMRDEVTLVRNPRYSPSPSDTALKDPDSKLVTDMLSGGSSL
jgi:hypothetical protein